MDDAMYRKTTVVTVVDDKTAKTACQYPRDRSSSRRSMKVRSAIWNFVQQTMMSDFCSVGSIKTQMWLGGVEWLSTWIVILLLFLHQNLFLALNASTCFYPCQSQSVNGKIFEYRSWAVLARSEKNSSQKRLDIRTKRDLNSRETRRRHFPTGVYKSPNY